MDERESREDTLKIATWNLQGRRGARAAMLGDALRVAGGADLALLQEVSDQGVDAFREAAELDWSIHIGREFSEMLDVVGRHRGPRCVAIAGRGPRPKQFAPFPDMHLPEKVLATWVEVGDQVLTVVSYHAPTGVQHGFGKPEQAVRMARWLAHIEDHPVVMGGDFNTPLVDPPDDEGVLTHWHTGGPRMGTQTGDDVLVGPHPWHGLRDAFRTWLGANEAEREAIRSARPKGPLETTHVLRAKSEMRYDQIWLSEHFAVQHVRHLYDEARRAGTDHALVIADVELRPGAPDPPVS